MSKSKIKEYWNEIFGLDLRSLAVFRIFLGVILILDCINRLSDLTAHYSDLGVLPRAFFFSKFNRDVYYSIHFINGTPEFQFILFALGVFLSLLLILGYRTRLVLFLLWIWNVSLQTRNPGILQGGDAELRLLLFWGLFLPLSQRFSIDSALRPDSEHLKQKHITSIASFAYLIQISLIYICAALIKTGKDWRETGTAIYYALHIDMLSTHFGKWMLNLGDLLKPMSFGVWYFELLGMFIFFIPGLQRYLRPIGVLAFMALHFGFFLTLRIGLFPWIAMLAFVPFIPGFIWDRFSIKQKSNLKVVYDPACLFCKRISLLLGGIFGVPKEHINPAVEGSPEHQTMQEKRSWVVIDENQNLYTEAKALQVLWRRTWHGRLLLLLMPESSLNTAYRFVADRRHRFSWLTRALSPRKIFLKPGRIASVFILFTLFSIIVWNWGTVDRFSKRPPRWLSNFVLLLRLDQQWNMFGPFPLRKDGWFVGRAKLMDGQEFDILRWVFENKIEEVSLEKPPHVSERFPNQRWRKYMMNINERRGRLYSEGLARYLCRAWNSENEGEKRLAEVELIFMSEKTPPPGTEFEVKKRTLWKHWCFEKKAPRSSKPAR